MSINLEEDRIDIIHKIDKKIDEKLSVKDAALLKSFLEQYYLGVSSYDICSKSILELYSALISHWHFIYKRLPGEAKLNVYNPQIEQHGWQSAHTVIEVSHENKPFLLDSLRLALNKIDVNIHLIIHAEGIKFKRDESGVIKEVLPIDTNNTAIEEAPIYIEIDKQLKPADLDSIKNKLSSVLEDVDIIVKDWPDMVEAMKKIISSLQANGSQEEKEFLQWMGEDNFTFLGYSEYEYKKIKDSEVISYVNGSGLGVSSDFRVKTLVYYLSAMYPSGSGMLLNKDVLLMGKTGTLSTVHRAAYTDFVAIKRFDENGNPVKLLRFLGLYTSTAYNQQLNSVPCIRKKIDSVFNMAKFPKGSHDGKSLLHIISSLPRDELFNARNIELFDFSISILHLQGRQRIKCIIRRDIYGRYFSCLVFIPREIFTSQLRKEMQDILLLELKGSQLTFDSNFSDSILVRVHYMIRVESKKEIVFNVTNIEKKLIDTAKNWNDDLKISLSNYYGDRQGSKLFKMFGNSFPPSYKEMFSAESAVKDIEHIVNLNKHDESHLEISLYRPLDEENGFKFKIFRMGNAIPLSEIVDILDRMGLQIISERPHELKLPNKDSIWINDYFMMIPNVEKISSELVKEVFKDAFDAIWHGLAENDDFNKLVLNAGISWRDITVLRAYYKFSWQIGMSFSQSYVEDSLLNNVSITQKLITYFYLKFDPVLQGDLQKEKLDILRKEVELELESVSSLNEDRIIRNYLTMMVATVRTNFYQRDPQGEYKVYCSYKIDSDKIPDIVLPKPMCEIFVYSPQVEGVHLRGDRVARGGLRWSDRHEDFRTEVLGLMKAQQVKNAVIVPLGAKGGFVVKTDLQGLSSVDKQRICIDSYQTFIRGLLDLTDNYKGLDIIKPQNTVCLDSEDPYLVVAADKGTATFSDFANALSHEYNFWLGDAFASGGSMGYDHKKMGITARGAWESVKIHFHHLDVDINSNLITVVGVGDMDGDVFGNGMLLSDKLELIAAFNHLNIFFDPTPNPSISFQERKRLFNSSSSGWEDYNPKLISAGGGVFKRSAKKIELSPQMQQVLDTTKETMLPNELIKEILMLKVDLFYNGGIGTFVKSTEETNADAGDRLNDQVRINAAQLNVRVVCEGGNLGFTQLARIEYAKNGGIINTDAIDNSAGVNCSDYEVNIKVLLDTVVAGGDMTDKQRNQLLSEMQDQVASLVLDNNIKQNEALTLTEYEAARHLKMHSRLLKELTRKAGLDPDVEYLPNAKELDARIATAQGFTRPELAVLMAYTKIQFKRDLLMSKVPDNPYFEYKLINYFPKPLHAKIFRDYMLQHRLKRAIIATQISNSIIDEMGINFIQRLEEESGATSPNIAKAYMVAGNVFNVDVYRVEIRELGNKVALNVKISMLQDLNRLIRRGTRWFLRNNANEIDIELKIKQFKVLILELESKVDKYLLDARSDKMIEQRTNLLYLGVPENLAKSVSRFSIMFPALDIVDAAIQNKLNLLQVAQIFFYIGGRLKLGWFGEIISRQPVKNHWEALARASFRDDVDRQQRNITISILKSYNNCDEDLELFAENWFVKHGKLFERWDFFVQEINVTALEFTIFAVALRELLDLTNEVIAESLGPH